MRRTHPSRYHARHTSSAITTPWGAPGRLPLRVKGMRPRAEQRAGPRTTASLQEVARAWKRAPTPLANLPAHRWGPLRRGGGDTWTTHAWRTTPAATATKRNKRRPETWAYGSPGLPHESSSPWLSASDGCLLRDPATSRRAPAPWQTSPLAIGRGTRPPPPWTIPANGTMWPPGSWRIWGPTTRME